MAYGSGVIDLHAPVKMRVEKEIDGKKETRIIDVTAGRVIFNEAIPRTWASGIGPTRMRCSSWR